MQAGVSTACLYPRLLEESVYDLAVSGIAHTEIFVNTVSECTRTFVSGMADTMKRFDMTCRALHPFTCPIEPMLFFSEYERRVATRQAAASPRSCTLSGSTGWQSWGRSSA